MDIITGEKIQMLCDIYIGNIDDFKYNPLICEQKNKHQDIKCIPNTFNNPNIIFCYSHCLEEFETQLHKFQNKFILISHNSDYNVTEKNINIANNNIIIHWFAQNICFRHPKITLLPIGIANSMWPHGDLSVFNKIYIDKDMYVYNGFNVYTNFI